MELIADGAEVDVNASNVHLYVRKYAELRMVRCQEKALAVSQRRAWGRWGGGVGDLKMSVRC